MYVRFKNLRYKFEITSFDNNELLENNKTCYLCTIIINVRFVYSFYLRVNDDFVLKQIQIVWFNFLKVQSLCTKKNSKKKYIHYHLNFSSIE